MKSRVKVLILAMGLTVVTSTQASFLSVTSPDNSIDVATGRTINVDQNESTIDSSADSNKVMQQDNPLAIIHPCYRWPHPCD